MRLLYFTRSYTVHDARWLRALAPALAEIGFLALRSVDTRAIAAAHNAVEVLSPPTTEDTSHLRAIIERWAPDVILAGPITDAGYWAASIAPERTVLMSWAFDVLHEPSVDRTVASHLHQSLQRGAGLFTDCDHIRQVCETIAGRRFADACVLPWGLTDADLPAPVTGWRERLGDSSATVVIHARGSDAVHQPQRVLEAFALAHRDHPRLRLWLAGTTCLPAELQRFLDQKGLREAVRVLGRLNQAELAGCLREADVHLSLSRSDGSSITLLQAMHAGLPCVVADLPSNREWLDADRAWFSPLNDPTETAALIHAASQLGPDSRATLAERQRRVIAERAQLTVNLPRLLALLHTVANRVARPSSLTLQTA